MGTNTTVLTTEQAAVALGISENGVRQAVKEGRLKPMKQGRKAVYPLRDIAQYRERMQNRFPSKVQARRLLARHGATPPPHLLDAEHPEQRATTRDWEWFLIYARDTDATFTTIAEAYKLRRQYVGHRVQRLMNILEVLPITSDARHSDDTDINVARHSDAVSGA